MSNKIINFPVNTIQLESPQNIIDDIKVPEMNDIDYEAMYAPPENNVCNDKCYKCGHVFEDDDCVWRMEGNPGYESKLDGSIISISICDNCFVEFLNN